MIKTLTTHGNSAALIIDKAVLELLDINMKTPLKIATDGKGLIISPLPDAERDRKFEEALTRVNARHGKTLKRLGE
ncbi:MAG: AbrB/MazE/SpoVT family DNA-binding domain-containing protein [Syntrophothermus sp.]|uniref:AbrB/MazE/SpoVT family DNA-binding domain-containing protein n=1 Tax=Syntrophothermus sp. TaxID=2736299 RepID=UPI002580EC45|nr:AbrB/MazE/SpoVT family DNA-binding domain-containing protein [Syntrophothermus sp.]NSW83091.1 AbrB/MazE/SpoVT family DNA-binding domain-containing protein [Syntrophothermus sp.]